MANLETYILYYQSMQFLYIGNSEDATVMTKFNAIAIDKNTILY